MFISLVFPFTDLRYFLIEEGGRLPRPSWPLPEPHREFIRGIGSVIPRPRGGVSDFPGEHYVCRATKLVDFISSPLFRVSARESPIRGRVLYQRLAHDGGVLARLEVGIHVSRRALSSLGRLGFQSMDLNGLLQTVVRLNHSALSECSCPVFDIGTHAAVAFQRATTRHHQVELDWTLHSHPPLIVVETGGPELQPDIPNAVAHSRHRLHDEGWSIEYRNVSLEGRLVRTWTLSDERPRKLRTKAPNHAVRAIRVALVRTYADLCALRSVMAELRAARLVPPPRSAEAQRLQRFLRDFIRRYRNDAGPLLARLKRGFSVDRGTSQEKAWEAFELGMFDGGRETVVEAAIRAQEISRRLEAMDARPNIRKLVDQFVRARPTVIISNLNVENLEVSKKEHTTTVTGTGNIVTVDAGAFRQQVERIVHGTSSTQGAGEEISSRLDRLGELLTRLVQESRMSIEDSATIQRDLRTFVEESRAVAPRGDVLRLTADGLINAASACRELISPVTDTVSGVLRLLGFSRDSA